jgi:oligopeptide transport system permease protein
MNEALAPARPGWWSDARRRLFGNRAARGALALIFLIALLSVLAPLVSPWGYDSIDWRHLARPPGGTAAHWLGTDRLGRDLFVRTLAGV